MWTIVDKHLEFSSLCESSEGSPKSQRWLPDTITIIYIPRSAIGLASLTWSSNISQYPIDLNPHGVSKGWWGKIDLNPHDVHAMMSHKDCQVEMYLIPLLPLQVRWESESAKSNGCKWWVKKLTVPSTSLTSTDANSQDNAGKLHVN